MANELNDFDKNIAERVAEQMAQDGGLEAIMRMSEDDKTALMLEYVKDNVKKVESIQVKYQTNTDFRSDFRKLVASGLK